MVRLQHMRATLSVVVWPALAACGGAVVGLAVRAAGAWFDGAVEGDAEGFAFAGCGDAGVVDGGGVGGGEEGEEEGDEEGEEGEGEVHGGVEVRGWGGGGVEDGWWSGGGVVEGG